MDKDLRRHILLQRLKRGAIAGAQADRAGAHARHFGPEVLVRHLIGLDPMRRGLAVADVVPTGAQLAFCERHVAAARADLIRVCAEVREELEPELLSMDAAAMAGVMSFEDCIGLVLLRGQYPQIPVVMVSAQEEASVVVKSREFGASGFIPKSSPLESIQDAVRKVLDGEVWWPPQAFEKVDVSAEAKAASEGLASLTPQQFRVLGMLGSGLLNKQIAHALGVSEATVKAHMTAILRKLGASNRTQAVLMAGRLAVDPQPADAELDQGL